MCDLNVVVFMRSTASEWQNMVKVPIINVYHFAADSTPTLVAFVNIDQADRLCEDSTLTSATPTLALTL